MGRRSRQRERTPASRGGTVEPAAPAPARAGAEAPPTAVAATRSRRDAAPRPPWGDFPLVELCALAAIALGVWGLIRGGSGGGIMLTGAALLGSVAGLEVALREHLGGYRSHTLLLAGTLTVATLIFLLFAGVERATLLPVLPIVLVTAIVGFGRLFKRRSGGARMRVR